MDAGESERTEKNQKANNTYVPDPRPDFSEDILNKRRQSSRIKKGGNPTSASKAPARTTSKKRTAEEDTEEDKVKGRVVKKKGRMASTDAETDGVMKSMAKALTELRANQLKKEDIAEIVNVAVDNAVTKRFDKLDKKTDKLEERVAKLEKNKEPK